MKAIPKLRPKSQSNGWIITFADLMSLLLTFFILLLSFSKMDVAKYQLMAESLARSFGTSDIVGEGRVGGAIIFADQPSPLMPEVKEEPTTEPERPVQDSPRPEIQFLGEPPTPAPQTKQIDPHIERLTENLVDKLEAEIVSNALSVSYDAQRVVVRFSEATTFPSGSEELKEEMYPILSKIEQVLSTCRGQIVVSGYTDDLPVNSKRFRSNWDLSAARAVSVVHQLILNNKIDANQVSAAGHAETNPLVANNSAENRAKNRRVEISVLNPKCADVDWQF